MKKLILLGSIALLTVSCVSKKKYLELEGKYKACRGGLARVQKHVDNYSKKIASLKDINGDLQDKNSLLKRDNDMKFDLVGNVAVMSKDMRKKLDATLSKVDPALLADAKTLKDSMNVAVSYNLKNNISGANLDDQNVNVNIDGTVVMISIADNLLFKSGSFRINNKAYKVLDKLAEIIKSEPSMDVMIEGHTDTQSINTGCIQDNWDLSVKRATSMVRILEKKYGIEANRLIASGRGSSIPVADNDTKENRAKNRRTKIIILPNLDKFFGMLAEEKKID